MDSTGPDSVVSNLTDRFEDASEESGVVSLSRRERDSTSLVKYLQHKPNSKMLSFGVDVEMHQVAGGRRGVGSNHC